MTLLELPMDLAGDWRESTLQDAGAVLARMREACLSDVALRSDRQPAALRVDDHSAGPPHIWLHADNSGTAWIVVDVGTREWCNLAYQFGHELGHVVANSWAPDAKPLNPCQWVEEACAEAFTLRGLGRLAASWRERPPFPNDGAYADAILDYRQRLLVPDWKLAQEQGTAAGLEAWFRENRGFLETHGGMDAARPAVPAMLALFEGNPRLVEDIGALNRWNERTGLPLLDYLARWKASCTELGCPGVLPDRLRTLLGVS